MTRQDVVNRILRDVETWGRDTLVQAAQDDLMKYVAELTDEDLLFFYNAKFLEELDRFENTLSKRKAP